VPDTLPWVAAALSVAALLLAGFSARVDASMRAVAQRA